jgi:glycosyltransferase involved in cell wall biosynthesis
MRLARLVRDDGFDLVHAHDARSHGIARVAQGIAHHPALVDNLFVTRRSIGNSAGALDRLKYASAGTRYIAISNAVRESLLRLGVNATQVLVVPSGIEVGRLAAARAAGTDAWGLRGRGLWIVGSVGALSRDKNPLLLLEAFARVRRRIPTAHLLYAGDGPLRAALEQRVRSLGLAADVTFAGRLEDVAPAYAEMAVFALASDHEGLCTALLDAMAAGVPVATTACRWCARHRPARRQRAGGAAARCRGAGGRAAAPVRAAGSRRPARRGRPARRRAARGVPHGGRNARRVRALGTTAAPRVAGFGMTRRRRSTA